MLDLEKSCRGSPDSSRVPCTWLPNVNIPHGHSMSVTTKKGTLAPFYQARYGSLACFSINELFLFWEAALVII